MIIRETYLEKIRPFYNKNIVKVITGIRRSGKSTLILQIMDDLVSMGVDKSQIAHINLDDYENERLKNKDALYQYIKKHIVEGKKSYLFLDEIQEVEGFEKIINSFNMNIDMDIYITGSNSKILASEFATYLTGRYISFEVFPFSFKEMTLGFPNDDKDALFLSYVEFGGFPQSLMFSEGKDKKALLSDLYNSIVIKDLTDRYKIRDVSSLEKYLLYLSNTISSLFSAENMQHILKTKEKLFLKKRFIITLNMLKKHTLFIVRVAMISRKKTAFNQ